MVTGNVYRFTKSGRIIFEICKWTNRNIDTKITILCTPKVVNKKMQKKVIYNDRTHCAAIVCFVCN